MTLIKIILALFLPPIAVFMQVGIGFHFWLNIVLTIFGLLPGSIHALWVIVEKRKIV